MEYKLSLDALPYYTYSAFRYFEKHEHHIDRVCPHNVLLMVFEGVLRFHEDGAPIEVKAGEFYIQRANLLQQGISESDSPKYYFIQFLDAEYTEGGDGLPLRGNFDFTELLPYFRELDTLRLSGAHMVEKCAVMYKVFALLRKNFDHAGHSAVIGKVLSTVNADIRKPFSLDEIAEHCGYSKNQIINIFKSETGRTPHAYINDRKLEMAKRLLLESESSLSSISIECGFGDYINLYRVFTKAEGCSPLAWQKKSVKNEKNHNDNFKNPYLFSSRLILRKFMVLYN